MLEGALLIGATQLDLEEAQKRLPEEMLVAVIRSSAENNRRQQFKEIALTVMIPCAWCVLPCLPCHFAARRTILDGTLLVVTDVALHRLTPANEGTPQVVRCCSYCGVATRYNPGKVDLSDIYFLRETIYGKDEGCGSKLGNCEPCCPVAQVFLRLPRGHALINNAGGQTGDGFATLLTDEPSRVVERIVALESWIAADEERRDAKQKKKAVDELKQQLEELSAKRPTQLPHMPCAASNTRYSASDSSSCADVSATITPVVAVKGEQMERA